jgi:hypothetical protein
MEAADADLVPAVAPLVSTRARPADTARKRAHLEVKGGSGPVLPSKQEAGATAVDAVAMRPVKGAEASTSPRRHRHLHGGINISTEASTSPRRHRHLHGDTQACPLLPERSRWCRRALCQDYPGRGTKRLTRVVGKTNCPAGTEVFRVQGTRWACKQRGRPSQPSHPTDRTGARHVTGKDVHAARKRRLTTSGMSASASAAQKRSRWNKRLQGREP